MDDVSSTSRQHPKERKVNVATFSESFGNNGCRDVPRCSCCRRNIRFVVAIVADCSWRTVVVVAAAAVTSCISRLFRQSAATASAKTAEKGQREMGWWFC